MSADSVLQKLICIDNALEGSTMLRSELVEAEVDLVNLEREILELLTGIQALRGHVELLLNGSGSLLQVH